MVDVGRNGKLMRWSVGCLAAASFQLDLDERKFFRPWIDDIVLHAYRSGIRLPEVQLRDLMPVGGLGQESTGRETDDNVVVAMAMPSCLGARPEAPFRDDDALVLLNQPATCFRSLIGHGGSVAG